MTTTYPIVKTISGSVKGISRKTDTGKLYYSFQHIPYVQQPKGDLRFKNPKPVEPWTETLDCTKEGPSCYRFDAEKPGLPEFLGSDDGLGVNIFTPNVRTIKTFPQVRLQFKNSSCISSNHGDRCQSAYGFMVVDL